MSKQSLINNTQNRTAKDLQRLQALPLEQKVNLSLRRIRDFINKCGGDTYVSFSGGKDSTVLLDLVRQIDPNIKAVFADTGLEFPEIKDFVKTKDNVEWVYPKMNFKKNIELHGLPLLSKDLCMAFDRYHKTSDPLQKEYRLTGCKDGVKVGEKGVVSQKWHYLLNTSIKLNDKCCDIFKKQPFKRFEKEYLKNTAKNIFPFTGEMAGESVNRADNWIKSGCNAFDRKAGAMSRPLSFWTDADIWEYIRSRKLSYSKIYDMGYKRTGCVFCGFGAHLEKQPNRFQLLEKTHPKLYDYCMEKKGDYGLGMKRPLEIIGVETKWQPTLFEGLK